MAPTLDNGGTRHRRVCDDAQESGDWNPKILRKSPAGRLGKRIPEGSDLDAFTPNVAPSEPAGGR